MALGLAGRTVTPLPTMTPDEVAAWENRVRAGMLWHRPLPDHGTNARYVGGKRQQYACFCPECSAAHRNYNSAWYYNKKRLRERTLVSGRI